MAKICPKCSGNNEERAVICINCGEKIDNLHVKDIQTNLSNGDFSDKHIGTSPDFHLQKSSTKKPKLIKIFTILIIIIIGISACIFILVPALTEEESSFYVLVEKVQPDNITEYRDISENLTKYPKLNKAYVTTDDRIKISEKEARELVTFLGLSMDIDSILEKHNRGINVVGFSFAKVIIHGEFYWAEIIYN